MARDSASGQTEALTTQQRQGNEPGDQGGRAAVARMNLQPLDAPCDVNFHVLDEAREGFGKCTRLGLHGLQLTTAAPLSADALLTLELHIPDTVTGPLSLLGRAGWTVESRWNQEWVTGIRYEHLGASQRRRLYDFVAAQLVRSAEADRRRGAASDPDVDPGLDQQHVLVVDDDAVTRRVIGMKLRKLPEASVHLAGTGAEAMRHAELHAIDVAVLDIRLPDTDGLTLLSKLRERWPQLAAILITSHPSGRVALEALRTEVCDFLTKPFKDLGELRRATLRNLELVRLRRERDSLVAQLMRVQEARQEHGIDGRTGRSGG